MEIKISPDLIEAIRKSDEALDAMLRDVCLKEAERIDAEMRAAYFPRLSAHYHLSKIKDRV